MVHEHVFVRYVYVLHVMGVSYLIISLRMQKKKNTHTENQKIT